MNASLKPISTVIIEAVVVGALLIAFVFGVQMIVLRTSYKIPFAAVIFISGALFHIVCEYTGVNMWYSKKYCQLMK